MPDYEVKQPDGRSQPLFWKDPADDPGFSACGNAGVEIYTSDAMRKRGVPALLVDGVDILAELKRARWFGGVGYVMGAVGIALAVTSLILIFLHH